MTQTMKTFVMQGIGNVETMDKPVPHAPGPLDAIVRSTAAMICTSDCNTVNGAIGERFNHTLGHEGTGIVEQVGSGVKTVKPGDRVVVNAITPCYHCHSCQSGYSSQCGDEALGGWKFANTKDGTFAELFHVNRADANLTIIPYSISEEVAIYTADMMPTGFGCAEGANIPKGGTVAVFGVGPVGLMALAAARLLGAGQVIAIDKIPQRLDFALEYGADAIINFEHEDPISEIMKITKGKGVDSSLECVGGPKAFGWCIEATKPGGTVSNSGYHGKGETVPIPREGWGVGMADKTITTMLCPGGKERMQRLLRLIETERVNPTMLTTHRFEFDEIGKAFHMMMKKEDNIVKPIIFFDAY
ncbi:zinc-binding dehydrogenase [uncultured Pseudoteredinibacter sp.]|uniref:zinc-binding dehydrogenase n=1 Tax=uncultured Pseudoteredinibacter sp. TaxID=1641701 RepID=UPI00262F8819|nr:zinc-binding dehydrogenase [uncultured Pseudoteredinibacter sp.]